MEQKEVLLKIDGHTAEITLNRPGKLNALNPGMLSLLEKYVREIDENRDIRAVLIKAEGAPRAFCAGADITAWAELDPQDMWRIWTRRGHRIFGSIEKLSIPVVTAVDGIAFGGGLELALAGDIILATSPSRFAFPETCIAAVPGWGGTFRLAERIGAARAKQMIFTGEPLGAGTAALWGLVNEVCEDAKSLEKRVSDIIGRIAANAPVSVSCSKQLLQLHDRPRELYGAMEAVAGGFSAMTWDGTEGIKAFFEKRPPNFIGK